MLRVVVVGATGNVGTSVLAALADEPAVERVVGLARRLPQRAFPKADFAVADVTRDDLRPHFAGADAVISLAWLIQPSRDERTTHAVNVEGSQRVFDAAADAGVSSLLYSSSIGAYSPGPKDRAVDESWPTEGVPSSFYSRHKAEVEHRLDRFELHHPGMRVVRLRPGLVFKRDAASEIRRLFAGPFLPSPLLRPGLLPVVPFPAGLRTQCVHSLDLGEAFRAALVREARGAFNVATEPILDAREVGRILGARTIPVPPPALRALADVSWRARLQPTPPGWLDMAMALPIMDTRRARAELGWRPRRDAGAAVLELLDGLRRSSGAPTPPLATGTGGPARARELLTGVGRTSR